MSFILPIMSFIHDTTTWFGLPIMSFAQAKCDVKDDKCCKSRFKCMKGPSGKGRCRPCKKLKVCVCERCHA